MSTPPQFTRSRLAAAKFGAAMAFAALAASGAGLALQDAQLAKGAAMAAGVSTASFVWWRLAGRADYTQGYQLPILALLMCSAGTAMLLHLSYLLWWLGLPVSVVANLKAMVPDHYVLPLMLLMHALACRLALAYLAPDR